MLCLDEIGKVDHAVKIEQAYHEEIDKHGFCENCNTGTKDYIKLVPMM